MADFFRAFNRMVKMKQSAIMAYRPQVNGKVERTVQTLTRALKDWDDYAERLTFVLNTVQDTDGTHGRPWKLLSRWDLHEGGIASHAGSDIIYKASIVAENEKLRELFGYKQIRTTRVSTPTRSKRECKVKEGYARKLTHLWHGHFRVIEVIGNPAARLETAGSGYGIFLIVHLSKLKLHYLLPEDSWENPLESDEYKVERIAGVRSGRRTRYGRVHMEFKVFWKGYDDPSWVDEADLNCGALLHEYERRQTSRNRFDAMQTNVEEGNDP
ncbi:Reverse transcriptase [Phytophthora palmivora]|uniref:Reverse transcriptase n=1 Tax=Phytophthora palmivora TaxID=4796 RepID=A0A2P4Y8F3_9STRA|nr:Reverse transcriptase [Phytophthora palmivora]